MVLFVESVGVVGAGLMGARIAEVFAGSGKKVLLKDVDRKALDAGMATVRGDLDELVAFHAGKADREIASIESKNRLSLTPEQKELVRKANRPTVDAKRAQETLGRISPTLDAKAFSGVDLVIEAVVERMDVKRKVFRELAEIVQPRAVFASNTSSLPISEMAEASGRPGRFVGMHFFNPPTTLPLVEVIPGAGTDEETVEDVVNLLASMRNHRYPLAPVRVKEVPGFLVNRILGAMLSEAYWCYENKVAAPRDIDIAMKAGAGLPMGPLELSDLIGLDTIQHVQRILGDAIRARGPWEPRVIGDLVAEGRLGRKSGRGFFDYA